MSPSSSVPVNKLDRKHPLWHLHSDQWNTIDLLYESGVRLKNNGVNLLMKRPKELYDVYQERYRRLTYQDILANAIRWYLAKMFQTEAKIDPKTDDERFAAFLQDCDRSGTTYSVFARDLLETMMLYQVGWVLIDKPSAVDLPIPINTRADEKRAGLDQPYLVLYEPRQVINWQTDRYGNLNWAVIKTTTGSQESFLADPEQTVDWWAFDLNNYYHYQYKLDKSKQVSEMSIFSDESAKWAGASNASATLVDSGPHVLSQWDRVPIRSCSLPKSLWFTNACYLQLCEHLDFLNSYTWKLFMACFPQLMIYSDKEITGTTMGETSFLQLGAQDKAEYLEPDGKSFAECRQYLEMLRMEIYRDFHLQAQAKTSTATADGASGYSKEVDMAPANDVLNALGSNLRSYQQLLLEDFKLAAGMPLNETTRPDVNGYHFDEKPAFQQIGTAQAAKDLGLNDKSPTLEKILYKDAAMPLLNGQNEEIKKKVLAEIDSAPTDKEQADAEQQQQRQMFEQRLAKMSTTETLHEESGAEAA